MHISEVLSALPLDRASATPLFRQLYLEVKDAILRGALTPGLQLPPTRELCRLLKVSRQTVLNAWTQLSAEGYLSGTVGRGTFISAHLPMTPATAQAPAADFPVKTVRLVVPFPPGGATDTLARNIAEKLSAVWKQPVVVENKPGGNTMLGTDVVAKAAPDGHVLGIVTGSHVINPLLTSKMPYDTAKDLTEAARELVR